MTNMVISYNFLGEFYLITHVMMMLSLFVHIVVKCVTMPTGYGDRDHPVRVSNQSTTAGGDA